MLIEEAFKEMYPDKIFSYNTNIKYTGRIKGYNGNVSLRNKDLTINLSKEWQDISDDIKKGLIQLLLNKLFKTKIKTYNIDLYNIFITKIHFAIPKNNIDPILKQSFNRINEKYFNDSLEMPNLIWGRESYSKLGSYDYSKDLIVISTIFKNHDNDLLDFIMYHEALHKKLKFNHNSSKSYYHTKQFKDLEKKFENYIEIDKKLNKFIRNKKIKKVFKLW